MQPYFPPNLMYPGSGESDATNNGISHFKINGEIMHLNTKTNELTPLSKCGCYK